MGRVYDHDASRLVLVGEAGAKNQTTEKIVKRLRRGQLSFEPGLDSTKKFADIGLGGLLLRNCPLGQFRGDRFCEPIDEPVGARASNLLVSEP
jgi:hypothetical protein